MHSALISTAHAAVPTSQRDALISIYDTTNGPRWTHRGGWRGAAGTECDWYGVACDETRENVMGLELQENELAGPFPAAIGELPRLRYVFFYGNKLTGAIPAAIGKAAALEAIYAGDNALTGPLPRELGSLTRLRDLGLDTNQIDGTIPRELGNMTALEQLVLAYNKLTGPLPAELAQLSNLKLLSLSSNALSGAIPTDLGRLAKLEALQLTDNKLTGAIPAQLGDLASLVEFIAGFNQLSGPIPTALGRLANLEELSLDANALTGAIPKELGNLAKLRTLTLSSNQLTGPIPPELFRATALERIDIGNNNLSGSIPREIGALKELQSLAIYATSIGGTLPLEVTTLPKLTAIVLYQNHLTGPIPPELSRLTELRALYLGDNELTGTIPVSLASLANLETLVLSANHLSGPIPSQLGQLTNLKRLDVAANNLTGTIPDTLRALTKLEALGLQTNNLTGTIPTWIGELSQLQELFLGANDFTGELPRSIGSLTNLAYLEFADNDLTGTLPDFSRMQTLVYLRGEYNRISGPLPASIGGATNLADIYLSNNQLSGALPKELARLTKLATLSIAANAFEGTFPTDLPPSLTVLSLSGNRFGGTLPKEIGRLTNLQFLDLSFNAFRGPVPVEITALKALEDGRQDFAYNGLFTSDPNVSAFLTRKHYDGNWQGTQTVKPANVRVTSVTDRSATLQWDPIEYQYDEGGYQVVASKSPGGAPASIATTSSKSLDSIIVRNLEPSTAYFFTVSTVTHPHPQQDNLIVSDATAAVSATTTQRVIAPPDVAVTESTNGLVQIGGVAANEDSFTLTNFGDRAAELSIAKDGDFFTLETDAIVLAGGASRTIKVRSLSKPIGTYYGAAYVIGEGAADGLYIPVVLLSVARPAGSVVAEALDTRIEVAGAPGSEQIGTARFRNSGTARLSGVVIADQPWIVPNPEPITIDPGQTVAVNFRIIRSRKPQVEGAQTATLSLVYVDGGAVTAFDTNSSGITISTVTIVDLTKPPVTSAPFGVAPSGEIALFIPGVASLLRAGGTFGSDLSILNASGSRSVGDLRLYFSLAGGASSVATMQPLPSNQTVTLTNVVANVYNAPEGVGTMQVRSTAGDGLAVFAKMTSLRPSGTFSGELPVFRADRSAAPNEKIYLTGLRRTSDLVVQEVGGAETNVRIEFLDSAGAASAPVRNATLAPLAMLELRDVAPANAVTAIVTNGGSGRIVAYARVTDEASGDTWSIVDWSRQNRFALTEPVRVPLAQRAATTPSGGGGGKRRTVRSQALPQNAATDLTLFNPTSTDIKALVQVLSAGGAKSEREVPLAAMQTIVIANAVTTTDAATAHILVTPVGRNAQVVVTARTRSGSSGTAVPVVAALEGLRVGQARSFANIDDSTSATIAAASPATYTTAYGFVETAGESVKVRARLFIDKEKSIVTATVFRDFDLGPGQQIFLPEVVRSFAGNTRDAAFGDLHNLRLQIEIIEGKGAVVPFVVVTDNGSGDTVMRLQ